METFKNVVAVPSLSLTGLAWDWSAFGNGEARAWAPAVWLPAAACSCSRAP